MPEMMSPPADLAGRIRALGHGIDPDGTARIYADALGRQPTDGVDVIPNLRYGEADRHVLDVYVPTAGESRRPVVIFFHGGGYSRGDKADRGNVGFFLARNGVTALLANYRLAPDHQWPAGAIDVVTALRWAQDNAGRYGGDPLRIVLMGESAGAAHVAAASFVSRFHGGRPLGASGLVLHSGSYNVALERQAAHVFGISSPDVRNESYFGSDFPRYPSMSTIRIIDAPDIPSLILYAEFDPVQMQVQAGELFATLVQRARACPGLRRLNGHGHISQICSFNTEDTSVSSPVLEFVQSRKDIR